MPIDTISVSLIQDTVNFTKDNYFSPLLIFKSTGLKSTLLTLVSKSYEKDIDSVLNSNTALSKLFNELDKLDKKLDKVKIKTEKEELETDHARLEGDIAKVNLTEAEKQVSLNEKGYLKYSLHSFFMKEH